MADRDDVNPPASPPCSMDEFAEQLLPQTARASAAPRAPDWPLVRAFRAAERERLLAARRATALRERQRRAAAIDARIFASLDLTPFHTIGIYWPIKGEPDLRGVGRRHVLAGGSLALPVVVERECNNRNRTECSDCNNGCLLNQDKRQELGREFGSDHCPSPCTGRCRSGRCPFTL
jgi:hypothetical protein